MTSTTRIPYNVLDPFLFRDQLTDEERMVQDSAASFAQKHLMPRVIKGYREEYFDPDIIREMGEAGLLGLTIQGYGCAGINYVSYGLVAREIASRFRLSFSHERSIQFSHALYCTV